MADELNGRGAGAPAEPAAPAEPGALRVTIANAPTGQPAIGEDPIGDPPLEPLGIAADRAGLTLLDPPRARLSIGDERHDVLLTRLPDTRRTANGIRRLEVVVDGWRFEVDVESEARARLRERATTGRGESRGGGPVELRAIIPGRVVSVDVAQGDTVEAGGRLLVVEAMKMQNELRAPRAGTVSRVEVGPGQTVELGDTLVVIE